jgi:hypothetical protein
MSIQTGVLEASVSPETPHQAIEAKPGSAPGSNLSFHHCVDRRLVHRASISEVFVTDSIALGGDEYMVAGQLPRGHSMCESSSYDFNILLEFVRQASVYVTHEYLKVPIDGSSFIFRDMDVSITPDTLGVGIAPAEGVAMLTVRPRRTGGGRVVAVAIECNLRIADRSVMLGSGSLMVMNRGAWRAMRSRGREQALVHARPIALRQVAGRPAMVGRSNPRNVVISAPTFQQDGLSTSWLVVNLTHPYMFDHQLDHLPGNLVLEGALQAAIGSVAMSHGIDPFALTIHSCKVDFGSFGELDLLTRLTASASPLQYDNVSGSTLCPVTVTVNQGERTIATVQLMVGATS